MRRWGMGMMAAVLVLVLALPVAAEADRGSVRVELGPKMAGKMVTLYSVESTGAEETVLAGKYGEGWSKRLSGVGTAMCTELPKGMYLITMESSLAVVVNLPEADGSWMAEIAPGLVYMVPETGQPVTPVLWAMGMILSAFGSGIWYEAWHKRKRK